MDDTLQERPRLRRYDKVTRRILDAAGAVIAAGGVESLSINKLAARLDYTPGALYRYFPSKDALVAALLVEHVDHIAAEVTTAVAALSDASPLTRVVGCARAWRRCAEADPHRFAMLAMMLAAPKNVLAGDIHMQRTVASLVGATRTLAELLAAAEDAGALARATAASPAGDRPTLLLAGLLGVVLFRKQAERVPEILDLDRLFAGMLRALLVGWGATASAVDHALRAAVAHDAPASRPAVARSHRP